jgi:hypothetical protein
MARAALKSLRRSGDWDFIMGIWDVVLKGGLLDDVKINKIL